MVAGRKISVEVASSPAFKKELELLYARRSTVDALIRSLEKYARSRERDERESARKTA